MRRKPNIPGTMFFFSPLIRCAHLLPHKYKQGCIPAMIPVEKLVQAESFRMGAPIFVPEQ
jgi:hypothetical protein